ncbi:hypothetical protein [Legionella brunensis]|uniref:TetR family transporter regulatory protein n=1 Tax=Legionella brunensis TaxID=29422 RepID=A0A0W0SSX6_9GAMM|nr:hypothetical protein [Legionella brunensis]KTC86514.1 TetR family transporter regulatory protein [Legionella brunensis]
MRASPLTAEKIVDAGLYLAEKSSWERLRLFDIANHLKVELTTIHSHFREKNDLVDAFFDRADRVMLALGAQPEILKLDSEARLSILLRSWFKNIQQHRKVAREMIWAQLEPGHFHMHAFALLRISRTVQWWREAAQRSAVYLRRAIEETGLTAIYLSTMLHWLYDDSDEAVNTDMFLENQLRRAHWLTDLFCNQACTS